jgi:hypothetical protein
MPSSPTLAAALVLSLAAVAGVARLVHVARGLAAHELGEDEASRCVRRFAPVRAALPPGATVRLLGQPPVLAPEHAALLDLFAARLHTHLTTGAHAPIPGLDPGYLPQVAEGFERRYRTADNRDAARVRANLIDWWTGLAGGMRQAVARFALAPHLAVDEPGPELVVGDFAPGFAWHDLAARERLELVRDFGDGAVLFRARR